MSDVVDRLQPPMDSVVMATWYRTLGINSIHASIDEVKKFIKSDDNPYGGSLKKIHSGEVIEMHQWENINISQDDAEDPIIFDAWIYGRSINTVFTREHWWNLHLLRSSIERRLGLEPGSLTVIKEEQFTELEDRLKESPLTR